MSLRMQGNKMNSIEAADRKWILKGSKLTKRYGPGCTYCTELIDPEQNNQCPVCGTVTACAKIDFELAKGEILGIVGESGSGKSTLMQIVNLGLPADSGELLYREETGNVVTTLAAIRQEQEINLLALNKYERR